jgi:hypothetical protein
MTLDSANPNGGYNVGMQYQFIQAGSVSAIDVYVDPVQGTTAGWQGQIWDNATSTLLATATPSSLTVGAWNTVPLDGAAINVATGKIYVVSFWYPLNTNHDYHNFPTGSAYSPGGHVEALAGGGVYIQAQNSMPNGATAPYASLVSPVWAPGSPWPVAVWGVPKGGTTGQHLAKVSGNDFDMVWS